VTGYLRPAIKQGAVDLWIDRLMPGGADWEREIEQKLRACDIFILLVSRHSLSSDYVVDKEIKIIRERQAKGEAVHFYPLVLTPTPEIALEGVRDKNLRPRDGKPFSDYSINERYRHMNDAANEIAEIAAKVAQWGSAHLAAPTQGHPMQFTNRASLEAWVRGQSREAGLAIAARAALRVAPLGIARPASSPIAMHQVSNSMSEIFRPCAVAWVSGKVAARTDKLRPNALAAAAHAVVFSVARMGSRFVAYAQSAAEAAARAAGYLDDATEVRGSDIADAADAAASAAGADGAYATIWTEVSNDAQFVQSRGASALFGTRLWSGVVPVWARDAWANARANLPPDDGWEVWIDWYETRLGGGSRGEDYELVFASVPQEQWDKGPAAANTWIKAHLPRRADEPRQSPEPEIIDKGSLEAWLNGRRKEDAVAIASQTALRVAPLVVVRDQAESERREASSGLVNLVGAIYRANAVARVGGKYPTRADELKAAAVSADAALVAAASGYPAPTRGRVAAAADAALLATRFSLERGGPPGDAGIATADLRARRGPTAALAAVIGNMTAFQDKPADTAVAGIYAGIAIIAAGFAAECAADAARHADGTAVEAIWAMIGSDTKWIQSHGAGAVSDLPLWSTAAPDLVVRAWTDLKNTLPAGQDWDVWIDWYDERLRGGSRGEAFELVFASAPQEEWEKGPAAANAWIKAHLSNAWSSGFSSGFGASEATRPNELPEPLPGVDAPFAYGWIASQRVAIVAGAQNLPFYPHFSSEGDHRRALEACRVGGERLLKALRGGRYNARPEYGEALEYYLDDLPKTAGTGNILLANDQVRNLHSMFLAEARDLPVGFASRLKSVIANQFALNAFYDLVQRHNEAVAAGSWTQPFPLDAAKGFFGAVEDNTPRWFEREVDKGLRQVEKAEPRPVVAAPEPASASAIEPPLLPPGTPDAQDSWRRQMGTAANALWETFLQGRDMPVDKDEWRKAAEELGMHVRPILEFLRAQEERKE
jgi:TIR domain